ncbi:MAG: phage terminase small subunit [Pseudohongiellaceae bacterium]|jgi:phage terminase small subunit
MSRGRKPKATALKILAGTNRPDRERVQALDFALIAEFPAAPQHLSIDGAKMWNTLGPELVRAGVLTVVDLYQLQQLCYCWQRHVKKQKAELDITAAEDNALKALFSEFGMSWNARQKKKTESLGNNPFANNGKRQA